MQYFNLLIKEKKEKSADRKVILKINCNILTQTNTRWFSILFSLLVFCWNMKENYQPQFTWYLS
uniref:Uncharacterized protein n=1 Tax=Lotus japonicus TaxID=34305 RepID=I3S610_LOTJA|nr:unknown [Lotus japonicus]